MSKNLAEERMHTAREALIGAWPPPPGEEPGGMPVRKMMASVFRSRWFVLGTAGLGCLVGAFLAVTTPNTYVSEGTFLFTASGSESINVDLTRSSDTKAQAVAANAVHVLLADNLLRRVAERVTPEEILKPYSPDDTNQTGVTALLHRIQRDWNEVDLAGATIDEALKVLRKRLNVDRSRLGDVLTVNYTAHDARLARKVLSVYMEEAKKFHQEQYDDPKVYEEVRKRSEEAATALTLGNRALREFLEREAQVQSTFDFELERLRQAEAEAQSRLAGNRQDVQAKQQQIAELERHLQGLAPTMIVHRRLDTSKTVEGIQDEISRLEIQLAGLRVTSVRADEIGATEKRIENLKATIRQTVEAARNAPAYDLEQTNPEYTAATEQLGELRGQLVGDKAVTELLERTHTEVSARLRRLLDLEPRYAQLRENVVRAEEDSASASAALRQAELKRRLQLGNFSSLKVIDDASTPLDKEGPNRFKLMLGGLVVGLFAGLGLVVMRTVPDRTVRMPSDLEALEGVTVIGMLPRPDNRNLKRHIATRQRGL
ncbi:MAG: GumC family protein [Planctomycetota bacterium]